MLKGLSTFQLLETNLEGGFLMEAQNQESKSLLDLIEIIHFTENVSTKIHRLLDEAALQTKG